MDSFLDYVIKRFGRIVPDHAANLTEVSLKKDTVGRGCSASVLEFGSGEGTKKLLEWGIRVKSVEHDPEWLGKIEHPNHSYIHAPIVPFKNKYYREDNGWYDLDKILLATKDFYYDFIIVDGPPRYIGRGGFDIYFETLGLQSVPIIFDDVHRLWEHRLAGKIAEKLKRHYSVFTLPDNRWFGVVE
jgi:hypothetical protein